MQPLWQEPKPFDIGSLGLTYDELFEFEDRYVSVVVDLVRIITGSSWTPEDWRKVYRESSEAMWSIFAGIDSV